MNLEVRRSDGIITFYSDLIFQVANKLFLTYNELNGHHLLSIEADRPDGVQCGLVRIFLAHLTILVSVICFS